MHKQVDIDEAFKVYFNLGPQRSLRQTAELTNLSRQTLSRVARRENWKQKIKDLGNDHEEFVVKPPEVKVRDKESVNEEILESIDRINMLIDSQFEKKKDGKHKPKFTIKGANDIKLLVQCLGQLAEIRREVIGNRNDPVSKTLKEDSEVERYINYLMGLPPAEQILVLSQKEDDGSPIITQKNKNEFSTEDIEKVLM